jgi:thiol-disulfide isomerase/thioredoxin
MSFCPIKKVDVFKANWCGPCNRMRPQMKRLKNICDEHHISYVENIAPDDDDGKNEFRVNKLLANGLTKIPSVIITTYADTVRKFDNISTETWNDVFTFMNRMVSDNDDF